MPLRVAIILPVGLVNAYKVGLDSVESKTAFTMLLVYFTVYLGPFISTWPMTTRLSAINLDGHADLEINDQGHVILCISLL